MIISSIKILDSDFADIQLESKTNLIIGHTGAKKTLLYKLIMFLFGLPVSLDFNNVKRNFNNATFIESTLIIDTGTVILRKSISESFEGYINGNKFSDAKKYNEEINKLFSLETKFFKNGTKTNSFGFKELLSFISIPEEQLSSNKSIFTREGFSEKEKILNFFKYIVSGQAISKDDTKEQVSLNKDAKSIKGFQTALNRRVGKPSAQDIRTRNKITDDLKKLKEKKLKLCDNLIELNSEKKQSLITLERINSIHKTYISYLEEAKAGIVFKNSISDLGQSDVDVLFLTNIETELNGLTESIDFINKRLKRINKSISECNDSISNIEKNEKELTQDLEKYKYIEQYEMANNASSILFDSIKTNEKEVQEKIKIKQEKIDNAYTENLLSLCNNISVRLGNWRLNNIKVTFDRLNADFIFNNERLSIVPKGLKSIYSLAVAFELLLLAKNNGLTTFNTIIVDSLWVATDVNGVSKSELADVIIDDLLKNDVQSIIFENTIQITEKTGLKLVNI